MVYQSRIPLESFLPVSVRWLLEHQGKHRCECGCGRVIDLRAWHYWRGAPRFIHGHQNTTGPRVLRIKVAGYLASSEVARALGIGVTTLRRREGTIYPQAARIGGIRVYHEADLERLRHRNKVPPRLAGEK